MSSEPPPAFSYDEVPYVSYPYPQSHPRNLAALATMFGMSPPSIRTAKVLEIGCAGGGNLIPLAANFPDATFIGLDASAKQVDEGLQQIQKLNLTNIELRHQDLMHFDLESGPYDYVICHGVYSWVPPEVQNRIMEICQSVLSPQGVSYISYNTYPGWYLRRGAREMMSYHAQGFDDPKEKIVQAKALIDFLASAVEHQTDSYGRLIHEELSILRSSDDSYIFHEHLEDFNEPIFFYQFAERAEKFGMRFLSEAHLGTMVATEFNDRVRETLNRIAPGIIQMEQYMDFLRNRRFRQTLLCRDDVQLERSVKGERIAGLYVQVPLRRTVTVDNGEGDSEVTYEHVTGRSVSVSDPAHLAALDYGLERWPLDVKIEEMLAHVVDQCDAVGDEAEDGNRKTVLEMLLELYTSDLLRLFSEPSGCQTDVGEKPVTTPLARLQATSGHRVTNQRHEATGVGDFERHILMRLDGQTTIDEIAEGLRESCTVGEQDEEPEPASQQAAAEAEDDVAPAEQQAEQPSLEQMREIVRNKLERLAEIGLIVG